MAGKLITRRRWRGGGGLKMAFEDVTILQLSFVNGKHHHKSSSFLIIICDNEYDFASVLFSKVGEKP